MRILVITLALGIAGCADPIIKTVDKIVEVPVEVPCKIKLVDKPDLATDRLKKEDELDVKTAAVLSELERRKAYEKELEAAIGACQ